MNPIEIYTECGRRAGIAAKRKDMSLVRFQTSWLNRAISMEPEEKKAACRKAFSEAYSLEATPTPFY